MDLPDKSKIAEILHLAEDKGWLEIAAETGLQGRLTNEQFARFKPKTGYSPRIWRVTKEGMKSIKLKD